MDPNLPWYERMVSSNGGYDSFTGSWLTHLDLQDLSNPALGIINGWQARYKSNQWYANSMVDDLSVYAFDNRGQGQSPKHGRMDAVQWAIDANYILEKAFNKYDSVARENGFEPGNKILQGNCIGAMSIAALFAGKMPLVNNVDGVVLISPVSTFNLPHLLKLAYFLPKWLGNFAIKYFAEPLANKVVPGEDSEFSRKKALARVRDIDLGAAIRQARSIFWKEDVSLYWKYIDVPSLIFVSDSDPLTTIEDSMDVYKRLRYPIWVELEAADHLMLEGNIDFVSNLMVEFANDPWGLYAEFPDKKPGLC